MYKKNRPQPLSIAAQKRLPGILLTCAALALSGCSGGGGGGSDSSGGNTSSNGEPPTFDAPDYTALSYVTHDAVSDIAEDARMLALALVEDIEIGGVIAADESGLPGYEKNVSSLFLGTISEEASCFSGSILEEVEYSNQYEDSTHGHRLLGPGDWQRVTNKDCAVGQEWRSGIRKIEVVSGAFTNNGTPYEAPSAYELDYDAHLSTGALTTSGADYRDGRLGFVHRAGELDLASDGYARSVALLGRSDVFRYLAEEIALTVAPTGSSFHQDYALTGGVRAGTASRGQVFEYEFNVDVISQEDSRDVAETGTIIVRADDGHIIEIDMTDGGYVYAVQGTNPTTGAGQWTN